MPKKTNDLSPKPTVLIQGLCLLTLLALFIISAIYKTEVPLPIYAIIAGILFGIGNVSNIFGGRE